MVADMSDRYVPDRPTDPPEPRDDERDEDREYDEWKDLPYQAHVETVMKGLRRDAARYRWCRMHLTGTVIKGYKYGYSSPDTPEEFDTAVDTVMKNELELTR